MSKEIKPVYVTYDQAVWLKEKGFDVPTLAYRQKSAVVGNETILPLALPDDEFQWKPFDWNNYSKEEYKTDFLNYFNYILKWGSSHKTEKFVIEGVHFFAYSELMQYLNIYPTIIVDKSIIISSLYGAYRDMQQDLDTEDGYKFPTYIKNMYYIFMNNFNNIRKNLNSFVFSAKAGK
jgi:hypothetical protein